MGKIQKKYVAHFKAYVTSALSESLIVIKTFA